MNADSTLLRDAVVVITGASSGIGQALARALVKKRPGRVWLVARRLDRLHQLADELGPVARPYACDLADADARAELVSVIPKVDVLVNNAGCHAGGWLVERARQQPDSLTQLVQVNCEAPVHLVAMWAPGMVERGRGFILNVGSIAGMFPTPGTAAYGGSKAFINNFSEALYLELRSKGVHVHLSVPGPVDDTEFFNSLQPASYYKPSSIAVSAERVAFEAVNGLLSGTFRRTPGVRARLASRLMRATPRPIAHRILDWWHAYYGDGSG